MNADLLVITVSEIVNIVHCTVRTLEQYHFEITRYTNSLHASIHTRQYFMLATLIKVIIFKQSRVCTLLIFSRVIFEQPLDRIITLSSTFLVVLTSPHDVYDVHDVHDYHDVHDVMR